MSSLTYERSNHRMILTRIEAVFRRFKKRERAPKFRDVGRYRDAKLAQRDRKRPRQWRASLSRDKSELDDAVN